MPIEAIGAGATEWSIPGVGGVDGTIDGTPGAGGGGGGFGGMLGKQISALEGLQNDASSAARSLADGTATDASQVVVAVERAQLAMQLAAQLRTKGVEAISEVMRTQV
jgi:flagellar hook-basal body complex protein FliE